MLKAYWAKVNNLLTRAAYFALIACFTLASAAAHAEPPASVLSHLRRGVNITGWFRFPASRDPLALARWMSDAAMADLRQAGFDFVRLAVDPDVVAAPSVREMAIGAVCRLQRQGLAVVVDAHPTTWHLETDLADRAKLIAFWRAMAPDLRRCDPNLMIPEIVNEPVFAGHADDWAALQHTIVQDLRAGMPDSTILLTGADWGSIDGLLALTPEADPNVLYSFHFYEPTELTTLAAWHPGLDRAALSKLPFPVADVTTCAGTGDNETAEVVRYYCATGWTQATLARRIGQAAAWARRQHVRLLAGEFGASADLNPTARRNWLRAMRESLDAEGIGWALWGYDDIMGFAVVRPPVARPILDGNILVTLGMRRRP